MLFWVMNTCASQIGFKITYLDTVDHLWRTYEEEVTPGKVRMISNSLYCSAITPHSIIHVILHMMTQQPEGSSFLLLRCLTSLRRGVWPCSLRISRSSIGWFGSACDHRSRASLLSLSRRRDEWCVWRWRWLMALVYRLIVWLFDCLSAWVLGCLVGTLFLLLE